MDWIPTDLVLPLLAIDLLILVIVAIWPSDMKVTYERKKREKSEPEEKADEEDEEPPPYDGMASS